MRAFIFGLALLACSGFAGTPSGWVQENSPEGFAVQHPQGWKVEVTLDWIRIQSPDRSAFAFLHPFMVRGSISPARWLASMPAPIAAAFPQARILRSQQLGGATGMAAASVAYGPAQSGRAAWLCSIRGRNGMLFAIAAPAAQYEQQKEILVSILDSFRFQAPRGGSARAAAAAIPNLAYTAFQDPNERAFTVQVPKGWKIEGGLFRGYQLQNQTVINATAPDQQVMILVGNREALSFFSPLGPMAARGPQPGSVYMGSIVAPLETARQFLSHYVPRRLGNVCANVRIIEARDLPDQSQMLHQTMGHGNPALQFNVGEASFNCVMQGQERRGYYSAILLMTGARYFVNWSVIDIAGYLAAPDRMPLAEAVLGKIRRTYRPDPGWLQAHSQTAVEISAQNQATATAVQDMIEKSYWNRNRVQNNTQRNTVNTILNRVDLKDEETGELYQAVSGSNYYSLHAQSDTIFGTQTDDPPAPSIPVTRLKEW